MQLHAIRTLARELMNDHGLHDWDFAFDRAVRRAGACHSTARKITLSSALMVNWAEAEVTTSCSTKSRTPSPGTAPGTVPSGDASPGRSGARATAAGPRARTRHAWPHRGSGAAPPARVSGTGTAAHAGRTAPSATATVHPR